MQCDGGVRRYGLIISVLFLIACVVYLLVIQCTGIETEVMRDRFWKNAEPLSNGDFPMLEYPPFSMVFIAIPRIFADTPFGYNIAYVAEVLVFMVIGLWLTSKLADVYGYSSKRAMLLYAVLMLLMFEFVVDRIDIFPAVITLAAVYLFSTNKTSLAFAFLAIGTMTKLYPALLFPVMFLYLIFNRRYSDVLKGSVAFIGTGVVIAAVVCLIDPSIITNFMGYHEDRPLQIESVAASVVYFISALGFTDVWIQPFGSEGSFGSDNLRGPLPDAVSDVLMPIMIVSIVALYALYFVIRRKGIEDNGMRILGLAILASLMLFMVANKVFSSQYLIWAICPVVFLMISGQDGLFERRVLNLMILTIILTQVNFAYNIGYLGGGESINTLGMAILLVRNAVAVYLTGIVIWEMCSYLSPGFHPGTRMLSYLRGQSGE